MNSIDEMLKNEKVKWKKLGEVCDILIGEFIHKKFQNDEQGYPVYNGGISYTGFYKDFNREENAVIISARGANAGNVERVFTKFWSGNSCYTIYTNKENVHWLYVYYYLKSNQFKLLDTQQKGSIPAISKKQIQNFDIPIPSLETQKKIVETLDKFTNYVTELKAELKARNSQYEYYRDLLLSEEYLLKISESIDKLGGETNRNNILKTTTLGDIGIFIRGNGLQKKDLKSFGKPVIHYGELFTKYGLYIKEVISFSDDGIYNKLRKAEPNDLLISTTSENVKDVCKCSVWIGKGELGFSGDMYCYRTEQNSRYIAYFLQTNYFRRQKEMKLSGTKVIRIHGDDLAKIIIPLPPIHIQNRVVNILDKFQSLLSNTQGLIPEEIEKRQKQYEYYREKLLTFELECDKTDRQTDRQTDNNF